MTNVQTVEIAKHAGFCFGVKRAVEMLETTVKDIPAGGEVATLGELIHNESYLRALQARGIFALAQEEALQKAEQANAEHPFALVIRAHGIPLSLEQTLRQLAASNPCFSLVDATCPFVQMLQRVAENTQPQEEFFLLLGDRAHPEVKGVLSRCQAEKYVFDSVEELENALLRRKEQKK